MADLPSATPPSSMPPPDQGPDEEINLRPSRMKARLIFWLTISVAAHVAAGVALWVSPQLRSIVFASFLNRKEEPGTGASLNQIRASRYALDQLTRKRIIESAKRMVDISGRLEKMRTREWKSVEERAAGNPHFREMFTGGLPALELQRSSGDASMDVPALYDRARTLEEQVICLYEQYKAIGLSLMTVSKTTKDEHAKPQALGQSLELSKLERPTRIKLDVTLIAMDNGTLAEGTNWTRFREQLTQASDLAEVMANNCSRIIQVLEKDDPQFDPSIGGAKASGGAGADIWQESNPYRGATLRPDEMFASDLASIDPKARIELGKHLGDAADARDAVWLAINTWWWIGPFPYLSGVRDEQSLRHAYPPEHGVDLDAVYIGKDPNRPLRWLYRPMEKVRMEPRDVFNKAIWYFYSEFYSDEAREVYANIASDDYGSLWLNGEKAPVYTSGIDPRPWVVLDIRQGCKLKLKKGTNRLLFKLDNNGGTTGFTVILGFKPSRTAK